MRIQIPLFVSQRDEVFTLQTGEWRAALKLARSIDEPWYRCQALSHVVDICPTNDASLKILDEAFDVANSIGDVNRKVSVSGWPISSAILLGCHELALEHTHRVLACLEFESNPVRRIDACEILVQRVSSDAPCLTAVLDQFIRNAREARSWKVTYKTLVIAPTIVTRLPGRAPELRSLLNKQSSISRFERILDETKSDI